MHKHVKLKWKKYSPYSRPILHYFYWTEWTEQVHTVFFSILVFLSFQLCYLFQCMHSAHTCILIFDFFWVIHSSTLKLPPPRTPLCSLMRSVSYILLCYLLLSIRRCVLLYSLVFYFLSVFKLAVELFFCLKKMHLLHHKMKRWNFESISLVWHWSANDFE